LDGNAAKLRGGLAFARGAGRRLDLSTRRTTRVGHADRRGAGVPGVRGGVSLETDGDQAA